MEPSVSARASHRVSLARVGVTKFEGTFGVRFDEVTSLLGELRDLITAR
jgi:hypothetical protein